MERATNQGLNPSPQRPGVCAKLHPPRERKEGGREREGERVKERGVERERERERERTPPTIADRHKQTVCNPGCHPLPKSFVRRLLLNRVKNINVTTIAGMHLEAALTLHCPALYHTHTLTHTHTQSPHLLFAR